ncbi:MAG: hypothetical protein JJU13_03340 [Balneolaceae bacterium]|nr:hypothetical protein [Balneolaceae bacterium]
MELYSMDQRVRTQAEHHFVVSKERYKMRWAQVKTKVHNQTRFVMALIYWNHNQSITWSNKTREITPARNGCWVKFVQRPGYRPVNGGLCSLVITKNY